MVGGRETFIVIIASFNGLPQILPTHSGALDDICKEAVGVPPNHTNVQGGSRGKATCRAGRVSDGSL